MPRKAPVKREGRAARGAGPELRGVQDCGGKQEGERMDAKFGTKFWADTFLDQACFFAALR